MMTMNVRDISDRNVIFKTRCQPCRIAVRADHGKSMFSKEKRTHFRDIWRSSEDSQTRIPSFGHTRMRFTENRTLKTEHPQQSCGLRFPYGTGHVSFTGLLEQMP